MIKTYINGVLQESGGLPPTPTNPTTKFLNGNVEWAEISVGSGGYASNLYFTETTSTVNPSYKQISYVNQATSVVKSVTVNNTESLIQAYMFDSPIGITQVDAGSWVNNFFSYVSASAGVSTLKIELYSRTVGGVETLLFSKYSNEIDNTTGEYIKTETVQPVFTVNTTDYLVIKVYGKTTSTTNKTISYVVGDGNASYVNTPLALRHNQLRGLNDDVNFQHITSTDRTKLNNLSGTNTGDETASTIITKIGDGSKINSNYLPSYVDDVLEFANVASFPVTGETGKIYIALDVNLTYRWGGSAYVEISPSIALGETSATAYRGDRGASAYTHSILADGTNPHGTTFANLAGKPTTIAGYGITDAIDKTSNETITGIKTFSSNIKTTGMLENPSGSLGFKSTSGNFSFNGATQSGMIGLAGIVIGGYEKTAFAQFNGLTDTMLKVVNTATGKTATDGFDVGITSDGTAEIRQRENKPLKIYTNNALTATFESGKLGLAGATNPKSQIQIGNKANIFNGANVPSANWLDLGYNIYFDGGYKYTSGTGATGDEASLLEIGNGLAYYTADAGSTDATVSLTKRLEVAKDRVQIPLLAGTGNRMVVADSTGNLSASLQVETGNWTPVLKGIEGGVAVAGGENKGAYTKIGKLVIYNACVQWTAITGTITGHRIISGLPYASSATVVRGCATSGRSVASSLTCNANRTLGLMVTQGDSFISVGEVDVQSGGDYFTTITVGSSGTLYSISGYYYTD